MPETSPQGQGWRWRSDLPIPCALFPLGWEVQSPRHFKGAWCKTSWPRTWPIQGGEISFLASGIFPLQQWDSIPHLSPDIGTDNGSNSGTVQMQTYNAWVNISVFICLCLWRMERERVDKGEKKCSPESTALFRGKRENECCLAKINKWVSQQKENILKLTDVSSLCICYYFCCQGLLQRLSHCLATMIHSVIMLVFTVQMASF